MTRHWIGFHHLATMGARHTKLVELPALGLINHRSPNSRGTHGAQFVTGPVVPISEHLNPLGVWGPDRKPNPCSRVLRAKQLPESPMSALIKEMNIDLTQHGFDESGVGHS